MDGKSISVCNEERGASAVEYALLISLVVGVIIVAVAALGLGVLGLYGDTCNELATAINASSC
jgi:Flp pilus assembly pilin Flp